ncbi:MAG: hypothetical protein ABL308_05975 [Oceanicaulis sp.]
MIEDATPFVIFGGFFAVIGVLLAAMGIFADLRPREAGDRRGDGKQNG